MQIIPRTDVPNTYIVHSGEQTYHVDLRDPFDPTCDCAHFIYRDQTCKHIALCQDWRDGE